MSRSPTSCSNVSSWLAEIRSTDCSRPRGSMPRALSRSRRPALPGSRRRKSASSSAASWPIVSRPAPRSRCSTWGRLLGACARRRAREMQLRGQRVPPASRRASAGRSPPSRRPCTRRRRASTRGWWLREPQPAPPLPRVVPGGNPARRRSCRDTPHRALSARRPAPHGARRPTRRVSTRDRARAWAGMNTACGQRRSASGSSSPSGCRSGGPRSSPSRRLHGRGVPPTTSGARRRTGSPAPRPQRRRHRDRGERRSPEYSDQDAASDHERGAERDVASHEPLEPRMSVANSTPNNASVATSGLTTVTRPR